MEGDVYQESGVNRGRACRFATRYIGFARDGKERTTNEIKLEMGVECPKNLGAFLRSLQLRLISQHNQYRLRSRYIGSRGECRKGVAYKLVKK